MAGIDLTIWDVGVRDAVRGSCVSLNSARNADEAPQGRSLLRYYYDGVQGLVFIVDSNDVDRIVDTSKELHR